MSGRDGHLGELAAALVDGALDGASRDRALTHVAGCLPCRTQVEEQRRLKERLRGLAGPTPPPALADRLRAVAQRVDDDSCLVAPAVSRRPVAAGRRRVGTARARVPGGAPRPGSVVSRLASRRVRRTLGGAGIAGLALGAAVTLGAGRAQSPVVSPPVGRYTVEHARTTGGFPGADPAAGAVVTVSVGR